MSSLDLSVDCYHLPRYTFTPVCVAGRLMIRYASLYCRAKHRLDIFHKAYDIWLDWQVVVMQVCVMCNSSIRWRNDRIYTIGPCIDWFICVYHMGVTIINQRWTSIGWRQKDTRDNLCHARQRTLFMIQVLITRGVYRVNISDSVSHDEYTREINGWTPPS